MNDATGRRRRAHQMIRRGQRCSVCLWLAVLLTVPGLAGAERWSRKYINSLPDSAFASIELTPDGNKRRHLPHHNQSGALDLPHLLNALARHSQVQWIDPAHGAPAQEHLRAHMQQVRAERLARIHVRLPLDVNQATAEELEQLPFIGPARAFAILEERERRGRFQFVEELREVIGIGPFIYEAIEGLVTVRKN
ncbi:MAG: ComEA family DNA-binding protein [Candidatus Methylomirabilales bacterium]